MTGPLWLYTIRSGPVLHVWRDGAEVVAGPIDHAAGLCLLADLARALAAAQGQRDAMRQTVTN